MHPTLSIMLRLRGLTAPVFTPLFENGSLNLQAIEPYAKHLGEHNVSNIFIGGTSGEFPSFSVDERKSINQEWIKQGKKHLSGHVIVHIGASALCDAQVLAKHAAESGADAVASLTPYYLVPMSVNSMVAYFTQLTNVVPNTPFLYYHFPGRTKCQVDLKDFTASALKEIPTFFGIKYTDTDMNQLREMKHLFGDNLQIFNGYDNLLIEAMKMGIFEGVGAMFNFMPGAFLRLEEAVRKHDMIAAEKEAEFVNEVLAVMTKHCKDDPIAGLKDIIRATCVKEVGKARLPLVSCTDDEISQLKTDLEKIDFFSKQF